MMLIICKLYVWIHITWEAYVMFNVYRNKWLLIAPPECSLPHSQTVEASLKIKIVSSGSCMNDNIISCHWSSPSPLAWGSYWGFLPHTWCVLETASLNRFFHPKAQKQMELLRMFLKSDWEGGGFPGVTCELKGYALPSHTHGAAGVTKTGAAWIATGLARRLLTQEQSRVFALKLDILMPL